MARSSSADIARDAEATKPAASKIGFVRGRGDKVILHNRKREVDGRLNIQQLDPNCQTWALFKQQIRGMVLTVLFLGWIIGMLLIFRYPNVTYQGRLAYNAISTGLALGLGLNFFEVFKDMAKVVRWRILSSRNFSVREVDLVMGSESLIKTFQLALESWRKPLIGFACLLWIVLNILAQTAVAILPLFYTLDRGGDSTGVTLSAGTVDVPRINCFRRNNDTACARPEVASSIASALGVGGAASNGGCPYNTDDDIGNGDQNCIYFKNTAAPEYAVRFPDLNPDDFNRTNYPFLQTGRIVKIAALQCNRFLPPPASEISTILPISETSS